MRDKPFTVATLLERVRAAHELEDVTSKSPVAVVNYANKQQRNAWDKGKTKPTIKKKQLGLCSKSGCTTVRLRGIGAALLGTILTFAS